jgi:hypothetical protein
VRLGRAARAKRGTRSGRGTFPDQYIRHRERLGRIDEIVASDKLERKDGTFRIVPGLTGQCRSFESVNTSRGIRTTA